ncbi:hypothetical protein KSS87_022343 [Heliosperma pusillum]|nr:hypothetical protein KSS87_017203 [Heliosperma pusillum]KAH9617998.1 hypothetical protein KSS87_022343 [Heliosperma pusillum]
MKNKREISFIQSILFNLIRNQDRTNHDQTTGISLPPFFPINNTVLKLILTQLLPPQPPTPHHNKS